MMSAVFHMGIRDFVSSAGKDEGRPIQSQKKKSEKLFRHLLKA